MLRADVDHGAFVLCKGQSWLTGSYLNTGGKQGSVEFLVIAGQFVSVDEEAQLLGHGSANWSLGKVELGDIKQLILMPKQVDLLDRVMREEVLQE